MDEIGAGEAHLWYAIAEEVSEPGHVAVLESLLTPDERARQLRYRFAEDRHRFLVARGLLRWTLARYLGLSPEGLRFGATARGKPTLQPGLESAPSSIPLRFNLSRTRRLAACVVAIDGDVGVDVEDRSRLGNVEEIARAFAPSEQEELRATGGELRKDRFLTYWTLKEAYVKARGDGLAIPLDSFAFTLAPPAPPTIAFGPGAPDDPADWRFAHLNLTEDHVAAVALCTRQVLKLIVRRTIPFARP
jgi:4'-phosphopantetheinyl transferase